MHGLRLLEEAVKATSHLHVIGLYDESRGVILDCCFHPSGILFDADNGHAVLRPEFNLVGLVALLKCHDVARDNEQDSGEPFGGGT